ncbi:MAG: ABC transporter ATP-binding protein [Proteobacteria bacterium]|nr:ABC transporter ATP-binding protein [Pseudomonadota bacterium]
MNQNAANSIEVNGISKFYNITHLSNPSRHEQYKHRHRWVAPWLNKQTYVETFWALRDISFTVPRGQILGIIGQNGAGKSTFLKVLSRIIEPSHGFANIYGRVSALLEVGTGFHPDLTGRENIYLNGTLLGMRRNEITEVFNQIIEFADIERFIDTPVKRYSSGMYVRLAFAVAAHLRPDVLIIDEVLSVGDALFQEKCLGRMQRLSESGRTVVFVSHSMEAVVTLCDRAIVLNEGRIYFDGTPNEASFKYHELCNSGPSNDELRYQKRGRETS